MVNKILVLSSEYRDNKDSLLNTMYLIWTSGKTILKNTGLAN